MPNHIRTTDSLFYAQNNLDPARVTQLVDNSLKGADDGELYLEYVQSEFFGWDDGKLRNCTYDTDMGFGLRAVAGETFGFAHSTQMTESAIQRAGLTVQAVHQGHTGKMDLNPTGTNNQLYSDDNPLLQIPFEKKVKLLQDIDAYARNRDPRVRQVSASLSASWKAVQILRAGGYKVADIRPLVRLNVSVYLEDSTGKMETGYEGFGGRYSYDRLFDENNWKSITDEAIRQADIALVATDAPAGEMTVVLGNGWQGILLHEAIGHGLEGDFNRKKTSAFSEMTGKQVAAKGITIVDDGTIADARGSVTVDDEGTPAQRTVLIEDGILTGYMQDRMNARLMGQASTGNGRRESYADHIMPRMTNTLMLPGTHSPDEIFASVKKGIYAASLGSGQVDITSGKFVFEAKEAYIIENGKIGQPVKGATLIGNGPDALTRVGMIGNDFAMDSGVGTCGKDGQSVPVGVGQPTLRIDGLTVGGTAT